MMWKDVKNFTLFFKEREREREISLAFHSTTYLKSRCTGAQQNIIENSGISRYLYLRRLTYWDFFREQAWSLLIESVPGCREHTFALRWGSLNTLWECLSYPTTRKQGLRTWGCEARLCRLTLHSSSSRCSMLLLNEESLQLSVLWIIPLVQSLCFWSWNIRFAMLL